MNNFENFLNKANEKFNNKFDYSKFKYKNAKTKSIIICPIHSEFEQNPDKHLQNIYGCPSCALIARSIGKPKKIKKPFVEIKKESQKRILQNLKDNNITIFEILNNGDILFICTCGAFCKKTRGSFYSSTYCRCLKCSKELSTKNMIHSKEQILESFKNLYDNKYTYIFPQDYRVKRDKITIICPEHGSFIKSVQKHLSGQDCPKCVFEQNLKNGLYPGGYSDKFFEENPHKIDNKAYLYYVKIKGYYKIGITVNLYDRLKSLKSKFKANVEVIDVLETTLQKAYNIEQKILNDYKKHRVFTKLSTELFKFDILKYYSLDLESVI